METLYDREHLLRGGYYFISFMPFAWFKTSLFYLLDILLGNLNLDNKWRGHFIRNWKWTRRKPRGCLPSYTWIWEAFADTTEGIIKHQQDLLMCTQAHTALLFLHGEGSLEDPWECPLVKHAEKVTVHFQLTSLQGWSTIIYNRHLGHLKTTSNFPVMSKPKAHHNCTLSWGTSAFLIPEN